MSILLFEDDELDIMIDTINMLQMCYHPNYAPNGKFTSRNIFELTSKEITVILDKNLVSPICEIARTGKTKDLLRLQKTAMFVIWLKYINARVSCGIGLLENDTSGLCSVSGEEERKLFLHGMDNIPDVFWKGLAFGYIECIPPQFTYKALAIDEKTYDYTDNFLFLSNEAAMIKIVQLIRTADLSGFNKFLTFLKWYADNLDVAESVIVYAAMIFSNVPNIAMPKGAKSQNYDKITYGIKNQAWDLTYITTWSMMYSNETDNQCFMFATDDITQKFILANILPQGEWINAVASTFKTKTEHQELEKLLNDNFGKNRIRPFINMPDGAKIQIVRNLICNGYKEIKDTIL